MITKENKSGIVKKYAVNAKDVGSSQVQIALLTERIKSLSGHLKGNKKDYSSQRGLLKLVGQRRRLLGYVKRSDFAGYNRLIQQLDLRK
ncbi:MAG TPA: 30S ribosomal protein S15 [Elusimicrobiota bacterium]|nr:30S ribosomal protein S15 [Elusimicrobiota bacterium]